MGWRTTITDANEKKVFEAALDIPKRDAFSFLDACGPARDRPDCSRDHLDCSLDNELKYSSGRETLRFDEIIGFR